MKIKQNKRGFSLIELVVVCLIIGILTSIALPKYRRSVNRARLGEVFTLMRSIYDSCERYSFENGPWAISSTVSKDDCKTAISKGGANFRKLDIIVKGTYENNAKTLKTDNFRYTLVDNTDIANIISAEPVDNRLGEYSGVTIGFTGSAFTCQDPQDSPGVCAALGASTWNEQ